MHSKQIENTKLLKIKSIIYNTDFSNIINRLVLIERWTKEQAEEVCRQYRNFLYLNKKYGKKYMLPPSKDIDCAWHAHILYTEDYVNFCNSVFGEYFHHRPHRGFSENNNFDEIRDNFIFKTQKLYFEEFGTYIYEIRSDATALFCDLKRILYFKS